MTYYPSQNFSSTLHHQVLSNLKDQVGSRDDITTNVCPPLML